jgi:hypothetical protein
LFWKWGSRPTVRLGGFFYGSYLYFPEYLPWSYNVYALVFGILDYVVLPENIALDCLDIPVAIHATVAHEDAAPSRSQTDVVFYLVIVL